MGTARASSRAVRPLRVTMLLENNPYPQDVRVRAEARSLARAGYRVRVIAPRANGEPPREMVDDVAVERYRLPLVHSGSSRRMLLEYVIAHAQLYWRGILALARGADVIHAHNPPDTLFPLGLLGRAVGCKFVFDQHDVFPELVTERYPNRMLATVARRAQGMSVRAAHLVITTNGSQRTAVLRRTARSQDDVIIVRNGLSSAWLQREVEHRRGALRDPRLINLRYQAGESTALEVVDAQKTLVDARNAYDDAQARYRVGLATLQTVTGRF